MGKDRFQKEEEIVVEEDFISEKDRRRNKRDRDLAFKKHKRKKQGRYVADPEEETE